MENTSIESPEITISTESTKDAVINGIAVAAASAVVYVVVSAVTKTLMDKAVKKVQARRALKLHVVK